MIWISLTPRLDKSYSELMFITGTSINPGVPSVIADFVRINSREYGKDFISTGGARKLAFGPASGTAPPSGCKCVDCLREGGWKPVPWNPNYDTTVWLIGKHLLRRTSRNLYLCLLIDLDLQLYHTSGFGDLRFCRLSLGRVLMEF